MRWAILFDFFTCPLARLRPTIQSIVIIIIIVIIGENIFVAHDGGIIAQSYRTGADSCGATRQVGEVRRGVRFSMDVRLM